MSSLTSCGPFGVAVTCSGRGGRTAPTNLGEITNETDHGSHIWAESHVALQVTPTVCFRDFHNRSRPVLKGTLSDGARDPEPRRRIQVAANDDCNVAVCWAH